MPEFLGSPGTLTVGRRPIKEATLSLASSVDYEARSVPSLAGFDESLSDPLERCLEPDQPYLSLVRLHPVTPNPFTRCPGQTRLPSEAVAAATRNVKVPMVDKVE